MLLKYCSFLNSYKFDDSAQKAKDDLCITRDSVELSQLIKFSLGSIKYLYLQTLNLKIKIYENSEL